MRGRGRCRRRALGGARRGEDRAGCVGRRIGDRGQGRPRRTVRGPPALGRRVRRGGGARIGPGGGAGLGVSAPRRSVQELAAVRTMVTGGAGFIGSVLVDRLLAEGHEVDVVDDFSTGSLSNLAEARKSGGRALHIHHLDITAPAVTDLMVRRRPQLVFHLAAQPSVRVSVTQPALDATVNVVGSLHVLEGARQAGAERVVFAASGGTLYGDPSPDDLPVRESHPQEPLSPYGVSKKSVVDYLVAYRELHALEFSALALANVYGPRQDPHGEAGVVAIFAERILRGQEVTVYGDGEQTRDFIFVDDVVDAFVRAATRGGGLVCNIGTGKETSVNRLLATMAEVAGVEVTAVNAPLRQGELLRSCLDVERASMQLGWRPWTELADGIRPVLDFVR